LCLTENRSKMTTQLNKGPLGEIVLDIYREVGEGNFLNRICTEATTGVLNAVIKLS